MSLLSIKLEHYTSICSQQLFWDLFFHEFFYLFKISVMLLYYSYISYTGLLPLNLKECLNFGNAIFALTLLGLSRTYD